MKKILKNCFISTIPVLTGYLVLGFGFGIIMKSEGFSILLTLAMSIFIYAGSMQYAAIGLLTGGASLITTSLTTLAVNARHIFYGISMIDRYKNMGLIKPYLIFSLTDETYSLVCRDNKDISPLDQRKYYTIVSVLNHLYWVLGTALGAIAGTVIKFNSEGIDFALTALFITIFLEQWLDNKEHSPALIGIVVSVCCLLIFGAEKFLIPAMLIIALLLCLYKGDTVNE